MAERFRNLVGPTPVNVAARSTPSGGVQQANTLAASFANFSRSAGAVAGNIRSDIGAKEGAAAGQSDDPEFRQGVRALTAYGKAYNNAALRSYAIRSESDLKEQSARLEVEAGTDVEAYANAMEEIRKGVLEEAPAEAHTVLNDIYQRSTSAGIGRINARLAEELRAEDRTLINDEIESLASEIAAFRAAGDIVQSSLKETQLDMLIEGSQVDGTISPTEAAAVRRDVKKLITHEAILEQFRQELDDPNGSAVNFIEDLKEVNRVSEELTPKEEQALVNALFQELNERSRLANIRKGQEDAASVARFKAGERVATVGVLRGEVSTAQLSDMVENGDLEPSIGRTLANMNKSRAEAPAVSDPETLATYRVNLLSVTEEEIWNNEALNYDDRADLIEARREQAASWRNDPRAREGYQRIDRALDLQEGVPLRSLDEFELRALDNAKTEYFVQMEALPPEEREVKAIEVAERVIASTIRSGLMEEIKQVEQDLIKNRARDTSDMDKRELRNHEDVLREGEEELTRLRNELRGGGTQ
jgi:hypothetical protein